MKTPFFIILSVLQLLFIVFLIHKIYFNKQTILGETSTFPIRAQDITFPDKALKFFYEPAANTVQQSIDGIPQNVFYRINSDTLRETKEYNILKSPGTYRIITLGDSFTFGQYMESGEVWTELLEKKINSEKHCKNITQYEVINLGVHGYDIRYSVERYKKRGMKYNPDMIIWFLKEDDTVEIVEFIGDRSRQYREEMEKSGEIGKNIYLPWTMAVEDMYKEYSKDEVSVLQKTYILEFLKIYGGRLVFITYNDKSKPVKDLLSPLIAHREETFYFDNLEGQSSRPDLFIPDDGHPNVQGHSEIMETVFNNLTQKELLGCQ